MERGAEMGEVEVVLHGEPTAEVGHGKGITVVVDVDDHVVRHRGAEASAAGERDDVGSAGDPTQLLQRLDCVHAGQY